MKDPGEEVFLTDWTCALELPSFLSDPSETCPVPVYIPLCLSRLRGKGCGDFPPHLTYVLCMLLTVLLFVWFALISVGVSLVVPSMTLVDSFWAVPAIAFLSLLLSHCLRGTAPVPLVPASLLLASSRSVAHRGPAAKVAHEETSDCWWTAIRSRYCTAAILAAHSMVVGSACSDSTGADSSVSLL